MQCYAVRVLLLPETWYCTILKSADFARYRCDVVFGDMRKKGFVSKVDSAIGRACHIELLETDMYVRWLLWCHPELFY